MRGAAEALGPEFAKRGWVFFMPFRGGRGLSASAGPYLADQLAALAWLRATSFVDRRPIAVAGNSFGGLETVLGSEREPYCAALDPAGAAPRLRHFRVGGRSVPLPRRTLSSSRPLTLFIGSRSQGYMHV